MLNVQHKKNSANVDLVSISTQLYRFKIELSDITRSVYESLDFRVAQHPSESQEYLVTRVLAYALNFQEGLNFSPEGLHTPDEPCMRVPDSFGGDQLWIEIGNPSPKKLHKASKTSKLVKVYTYKNPELLLQELKSQPIHRGEDLEISSFQSRFLDSLVSLLSRETRWNLTHNEGSLIVSSGDTVIEGDVFRH